MDRMDRYSSICQLVFLEATDRTPSGAGNGRAAVGNLWRDHPCASRSGRERGSCGGRGLLLGDDGPARKLKDLAGGAICRPLPRTIHLRGTGALAQVAQILRGWRCFGLLVDSLP